MELQQKITQGMTQQQLQSVSILQMSTQELETYLQSLSQENPLVDLEEDEPLPCHEDEMLRRLRWLEDNDRQSDYDPRMDEEETDPLARVGNSGGLEETLPRFVEIQLYRKGIDRELGAAVHYLADCLDADGYLRLSLESLAEESRFSQAQLQAALRLLQSLEPAGIGAGSLGECLALQLTRLGCRGPELEIVRRHLPALAHRHYHAIAASLSIPMEQVKAAEALIRELEPRPGAPFQQDSETAYLTPDLFVTEQDGVLTVQLSGEDRAPFRMNHCYQTLLSQSKDREVHEYLSKKLHQAQAVQYAIEQRKGTLRRCAEAIVRRQQNFFRYGPQALEPMRMADLAEELGVHESTISRTARKKYLQCARGLYPLTYFFSRSASTSDVNGDGVGTTAARALLRQLMEQEDPAHPFSDQKLSQLLAEHGCAVSRRTVAKYRDEMNIPGAFGRKSG